MEELRNQITNGGNPKINNSRKPQASLGRGWSTRIQKPDLQLKLEP